MVEKIKEFAKKKNTNLAQIEKALGFSQGYIRRWDEQKPSYDRVLKVAEFLNIPLEYLIETNSITNQETEIIQNFRESDEIGKETIINTSRFQAERSRKKAEELIKLKPFA